MKYLKEGFKKIVAMGEDGTINEVANGFFFTVERPNKSTLKNLNSFSTNNNSDKYDKNNYDDNEIPESPVLNPVDPEAIMGLIPSGTRNVLAQSLNLPQELIECCHNFVHGNTQKLDVLTATVTDPSNRSKALTRAFLNAAEIGFGAEVIDRSKR